MNLAAHYNALDENARLHWYEIKSILGQGGFGITYLAYDTNLKQSVAIKEYLPSEFSTRDESSTVQPISEEHSKVFKWGLTRFLEEAQTLAKFKHPNIVRVQSFFEHNNTAYMIMEYEEGQDMSTLIKAGETFDEQRLLDIFLPILDGLEQVHESGFIHRDIKPANIFIREDGTPVLIDFGSARHAIGDQTKTMTSLVSPGFAPFEQYDDADGKQGPWTDIYALGASLYCAMTGKPPLDSIKRGIARFEHQTDAYVDLAGLLQDKYSAHFLRAIDCALQFSDRDRPQSISEWRGMLCGEIGVPEPAAETLLSPDLTRSIETMVQQRVDAATRQSREQLPDTELSDPETNRSEPPNRQGLMLGIIGVLLLVIGLGSALLWQRSSAPESNVATADADPVEIRYASVHGEWETRWQGPSGKWTGGVILSIEDSKVASYMPGNGTIHFYQVDDLGRWEGFWVEAPANTCSEEKHGSRNWGVATFQFNESFTSFNGTWDSCGQGERFAWAGDRK